MRNIGILLFLTLFFISCQSLRMSNFIKNDTPNNRAIFKQDSRLYFVPLNEDRVDFYMQKSGTPKIYSLNDIQWDKYLLDPNSEDSETTDFLEDFGLEENNYGYKSAKDYFVSQYNEIFLKGMSGESLIISKYKPKAFNITKVDDSFFQNQNLSLKTIYSPLDSLSVSIYEPTDLDNFCRNFLQKYSDADFLIIVGKLYVTQNMFENDISLSPTDFSFSKGTIIFPKVIIDLKNNKIAGYHIGRSIINPGGFNTVRGTIETVMKADIKDFNFFF